MPAGVTEAISVDMGCVGEGLTCDERMVSICAKDSGGPYHYDVVRGLIAAAEKMGAPYAVDVYPRYGSDVEATLRAGYDIRHGLIGSGVYASHGYERSHVEGALATLKTLIGYVGYGVTRVSRWFFYSKKNKSAPRVLGNGGNAGSVLFALTKDRAQPAFDSRVLSWRRIPLIMAMHSASVQISATGWLIWMPSRPKTRGKISSAGMRKMP